jgi:hypothetical protein
MLPSHNSWRKYNTIGGTLVRRYPNEMKVQYVWLILMQSHTQYADWVGTSHLAGMLIRKTWGKIMSMDHKDYVYKIIMKTSFKQSEIVN